MNVIIIRNGEDRDVGGAQRGATARRHKRHDRGEDVMGFIYHPLSNTAQGTSNVR
jgi:hypothetical protein